MYILLDEHAHNMLGVVIVVSGEHSKIFSDGLFTSWVIGARENFEELM